MSKRQSKGRMGLKILQFLLLITRAGFLSIVDVKFALALKTKLKKANCRVRLLWYQKTIPLYITTGAFACLDAIRIIKLSSQEKNEQRIQISRVQMFYKRLLYKSRQNKAFCVLLRNPLLIISSRYL